MIRTDFSPEKHGFLFENGTFSGAFSVLCGGMSYAALDYYKYRMKVPESKRAPAVDNPLHDYIYDRQLTAHYYTWHRFTGAWAESLPIIGHALTGASTDSVGVLAGYMGKYGPLVICLYGDVSVGHHVIAIGCDVAKQEILLYDNNHAKVVSKLTAADHGWRHSQSGTVWKGWFLDWGHYTDGTKYPPTPFRLCVKCRGLFPTAWGKTGVCSVGGQHSPDKDREYFLPVSDEGERGWRLCSRCNTIFHAPSGQATGWCANGETHSAVRLNGVLLEFGVEDFNEKGQNFWHKCKLCYSLFFAGQGNGNCTIGGTHERSGHYAIDFRTV